MAAALRAKGLLVALLTFEGEGHGFRQGATIRRTLEAELWFYGRIFGFEPANTIEPIEIDNWPG
jgi:dipeptidyl aminopeptidase/acylaminoacyl peptidase